MPIAKIKLFEVESLDNGKTRRFQSQLYLGRMAVDFVIIDGKLKVWKGLNFIETDHPYEIVNSIEEMKHQQL